MKPKTVLIALFLSFFLPLSVTHAQGPGMRHGPAMGIRPWREEPRSLRALELNLSEEQTKNLDLIHQSYIRETQTLRAELLLRMLELRECLTNPSVKADSIRAKYLETIEIQSKLEEKTIDYLIKVRNLLTEEQLRSWAPERELPFLRGMMHRSGPIGPMHPRRAAPPVQRSETE